MPQQSLRPVLFFAFLSLTSFSVFAQEGMVRGTIIDDGLGETIPFANVEVAELPGSGNTSDLDGAFNLTLPVGTYTLVFTYVGFADLTVNDVVVTYNDVTILTVRMQEGSLQLEEAVVTAEGIKDTETALATIKRKSPNLIDGISAATFRRAGDSDVGEAIKRVTGVTVEGGKNVFVRGLGDRYTKTTLNGMELPGLDPDRNNVQIDLFPTNVVDNIVVYKTFTPDLSGDFTGGTVDIQLKTFPDRRTLNASASFGLNSNASFNDQFLTYDSPSADVFALGGSARALPINPALSVNQVDLDPSELESVTRQFDPNMNTGTTSPFLNQSYSLSFGNQINNLNHNIGYNIALSYRNTNQFFDAFQSTDWWKNENTAITELDTFVDGFGQVSLNDVFWNGLISGAIKSANSSYSVSLFHTQNGVKSGQNFSDQDFEKTFAILDRTVLFYNQRSITNLLFETKQSFHDGKTELEVKISPSLSLNKDPDFRITALVFEPSNSTYNLNPGDGGRISRFWREMEEFSLNGKVNGTFKLPTANGIGTSIKGGLAYVFRNRDFIVREYNFKQVVAETELPNDPDYFFEEENLYQVITNSGVIALGNTEPSNLFQSNVTILGAYVMNELPLSDKLKATYGLRVEYTDQRYTGQRQAASQPADYFDNTQVLESLDVLPSLNLVYELVDGMNIRGSLSQTLARPSFKEKSAAQIYDPITNTTFIGNLDLEITTILNYDLRWEYFFGATELISLSAFYKDFDNPIELQAFGKTSPNAFTPRNVDEATVLGFEFEVNKNLGFISPDLNGLTLGTNVSFIQSIVTRSDVELDNLLETAREGEVIERERVLQGQSPFIVNFFLQYANPGRNLEAAISYNVQGERLGNVGVGRFVDIYEQPFNSLDVKLTKRFGVDKAWSVSAGARNILDDNKLFVTRSYGTKDEIFREWYPGINFNLGVAYTIR